MFVQVKKEKARYNIRKDFFLSPCPEYETELYRCCTFAQSAALNLLYVLAHASFSASSVMFVKSIVQFLVVLLIGLE